MKKKSEPVFNVFLWDSNRNELMYYDVMPYFISRWKEEKKRKHHCWNLDYDGKDNEVDDTKMPKTFDEFKKYLIHESTYQFWSRCQYEFIVSDWPCQKHEKKIDVHYQVEMNIDIITKLFMDYIKN